MASAAGVQAGLASPENRMPQLVHFVGICSSVQPHSFRLRVHALPGFHLPNQREVYVSVASSLDLELGACQDAELQECRYRLGILVVPQSREM